MITAIQPDSRKLAGLPCDTTQEATAKPVDRFEFSDNYVARLRSDDAPTWEHFYGYFRPRIRAKFRAQFRWEKVDDLTSDTITSAIQKIREGEPQNGVSLASYVLSVCRHKALETFRLLEKEKMLTDLDCDLFPADGKTALQACINNQNSELIGKVMAELKPLDRNLLLDLFFHGTDRETVRKKFGITDDGLRLKLLRARQKFQGKWRRD